MIPEMFLNDRVQLFCGDCRDVLATLGENSLDACVTDPPYGLEFMGKEWDKFKDAPRSVVGTGGSEAPFAHHAVKLNGSRNKSFQVFSEDWARQVYRVLKPGAHLVAMGGTRTYHRLACAIEDAGFEIRDTVSWLYGSGFPKSHDVSKGIDRAAGLDRPEIRRDANWGASKAIDGKTTYGDYAGEWKVTTAGDLFSSAWQGWHTALKPACELIVLARKPLSEGTVAANVLRWGTGAINVDGCRVNPGEQVPGGGRSSFGNGGVYRDGRTQSDVTDPHTNGRWPANVVHDGSAEVVTAFPETESGSRSGEYANGTFSSGTVTKELTGDSGSAARFFFQAKQDHRCQLCDAHIAGATSATRSIQIENFVRSDVLDLRPSESAGSALRSSALANNAESHSWPCHPQNGGSVPSSAEPWPLTKIVQNVLDAADLCNSCAMVIAQGLAEVRQTGCAAPLRFTCSIGDYKEIILSRSLASYVAHRESTDIILTTTNLRELFGCVFYAIGASINSARVGNEASTKPVTRRLWYSSKADADDRLGSKHPTVKPLDLMQWLVRLVTPRGGVVLDLFAGTGTTGEAAWREGMRAVLIEAEAEYQADIRRRMALALSGPDERQRESIKAKNLPRDDGPLFAAQQAQATQPESWAEMWAKPFDFSQEPRE